MQTRSWTIRGKAKLTCDDPPEWLVEALMELNDADREGEDKETDEKQPYSLGFI